MSIEFPRGDIASRVAAQLPKGIFLSVGGETPNVMTVGWGGPAFYWGKDLFVAPVRPQRHTHALLQKEKAFTLSVPAPGEHLEALRRAGTLSGRDGDKFRALGVTPAMGRTVSAPVIPGCALYLECRVLASNAFTIDRTDPSIIDKAYLAGDFHTLFYGEIVDWYLGEA